MSHAILVGVGLLLSVVTAGSLVTRRSEAVSVPTNRSASGNPPIKLTTLAQINAGGFPSAAVERGQGGIQTKTLGLNGMMVEVQNVKVLRVSGPNRDTDFDVIVSDSTVSNFKTENVRFPQVSGPLLVTNPKVGQVINIVGTAFFDFTHWEVHPIFAWQPASMGLITSVCAPAGTVSKTQRLCWSGTQ